MQPATIHSSLIHPLQANRTAYLLGGRCSSTQLAGTMGYCERTAFALLGMKRALGLRSAWANRRHQVHQGKRDRVHALVMVMRHDVTWNAPLPVDGAGLAATPGARLWLPFACELCSGPDERQKVCHWRRKAFKKAWDRNGTGTLLAPSQFLARACSVQVRGQQSFGPHCEYTVPVDWWWAGDAALADSFAATFDLLGCYSRLIVDLMNWPNAAPHSYWGLHFFHSLQLARRCEVGYVGLAKVHFDLERVHNKKLLCTLPRWPAFLKPDREGCGKGSRLAHMQCPLPPSQQPEVRCAERL